MNKQIWFYVSLAAAGVFVVIAIMHFAANKAEVIEMVVFGARAVFSANKAGKVKIKELG